jgi:serine/threonine protein kinase
MNNTKDDSAADFSNQYIGNYRLLRLLGQGAFASVYLGEHRYLKRLAAIKVLRTVLNGQDRESFFEEARLLASLSHPQIVRVLEFAVTQRVSYAGDGKFMEYIPYLVMDFAPGGSLRTLYPPGSCLFINMAVGYIKQIAIALQYAHDKGVIHRDVKPENCLLNEQQEVMLSDFGLAVFAPSPDVLSTQLMAGTLPYAAPEQLRGKPEFASDQYSLGVMAYEWLCGHRPFEGEAVDIIVQHMSSPPPDLRSKNPAVSQAIEEVVLKALSKDPQRRYPSVLEFAKALESASQWNKEREIYASLSKQGQAARLLRAQGQQQVSQPLPPQRKKKSMPLIIGIIVFVVLILGSSNAFYFKTLTTSSPQPVKTRPITVLPPLPGVADFTVSPPEVRGMVLVTNQAGFQEDHAELGASQSVVADFFLPNAPGSGKPEQASVFIGALVGRSGNNDGYAPIELYCNGQLFIQDYTFPGKGFQSNETSFQIPPGQLVYGKNEIKLVVSSGALSVFWLYRMGISTTLPSAPAIANFAISPISIHGMTLVKDETSFEGNHSALGAAQQVVIDFDLPGSPASGKPKLASIFINARVARSGSNHGYAPIELYSNGQLFIQGFTCPGNGFLPNASSFQIPSGQLVYGKNEIKLLVANDARSEFWLYSIGIRPDLPY